MSLYSVFCNTTDIPLAFREQFLHSDEYPYGMRLEGVLHHIWHKPRAFAPLFWSLGKLGILIPHTAREIPTTLTVAPGRLRNGAPFHEWQRTLAFPTPVHFNTTIVWDVVVVSRRMSKT